MSVDWNALVLTGDDAKREKHRIAGRRLQMNRAMVDRVVADLRAARPDVVVTRACYEGGGVRIEYSVP